jgi:NADH-quinone oxidoreductase subunit J
MNVVAQSLFYLSSLLAVAGALGTILSKNAIRAAMWLLLAIFGVAGLFLTLDAQVLAAIQIMVYAGTVVILFVFVIMLIGTDASASWDTQTIGSRATAAAAFVLATLGALVLLLRVGLGGPHAFDLASSDMGTVHALGQALFKDNIVPFELTGILLTAAIVGAMAVARAKHSAHTSSNNEKAAS